MALRLVRQTSATPNITNKDDTIMTRYAYGGYNGVVKAFGNECGYTAENGTFKVLGGRIIIDGWEIDIDGAGWSLNLSSVTGTQYHSVYAEINVSTEIVRLNSIYLTGSYPEVVKGDDLTATPNGTARLLLYNVKVENGSITEVLPKFSKIINLKEVVDNLTSGKTVVENATNADNAKKINDIAITKDANGVLKVGDIIIPQYKKLYSSTMAPTKHNDFGFYIYTLNDTIDLEGKKLRIVFTENDYGVFEFRGTLPEVSKNRHRYLLQSLTSTSAGDCFSYFEFWLEAKNILGIYSSYLSPEGVWYQLNAIPCGSIEIYEIIE